MPARSALLTGLKFNGWVLPGEAPAVVRQTDSSPMVNKLLQFLSIRCAHKKLSQPFASSVSAPRSRAGNANWDLPEAQSAHYVVCLDCGRKFDYDWNKMRVVQK